MICVMRGAGGGEILNDWSEHPLCRFRKLGKIKTNKNVKGEKNYLGVKETLPLSEKPI